MIELQLSHFLIHISFDKHNLLIFFLQSCLEIYNLFKLFIEVYYQFVMITNILFINEYRTRHPQILIKRSYFIF